jgi:hypothetical protein
MDKDGEYLSGSSSRVSSLSSSSSSMQSDSNSETQSNSLSSIEINKYKKVIIENINYIGDLIRDENETIDLYKVPFRNIANLLKKLKGYVLNASAKDEIQAAISPLPDLEEFISVSLEDEYEICRAYLELEQMISDNSLTEIQVEYIKFELKRLIKLIMDGKWLAGSADNHLSQVHFDAIEESLKTLKLNNLVLAESDMQAILEITQEFREKLAEAEIFDFYNGARNMQLLLDIESLSLSYGKNLNSENGNVGDDNKKKSKYFQQGSVFFGGVKEVELSNFSGDFKKVSKSLGFFITQKLETIISLMQQAKEKSDYNKLLLEHFLEIDDLLKRLHLFKLSLKVEDKKSILAAIQKFRLGIADSEKYEFYGKENQIILEIIVKLESVSQINPKGIEAETKKRITDQGGDITNPDSDRCIIC